MIDSLQVDDRIRPKKRDKIVQQLKNGKKVGGVLLIIRVKNSQNMLEIVSSHELYRLEHIGAKIIIIAIVKDKDKAYEFVEKWISQLFEKYERILSLDLEKEFDIRWHQ